MEFLGILSPDDELIGLFPLEVSPRCLHLPVRTLCFWQHDYCHLATPLIHREHIWEVLDTFWRWFESDGLGCRILDTNYLQADGPFHAIWSDFLLGRCTLPLNEHPRGLELRSTDASAYISETLSKKRAHELDRCRRKLAEAGHLEYRELHHPAEAPAWIEQFLTLESSGWKGGPDGDAIAKSPADAEYFRRMTLAGVEAGAVVMAGYWLDGRPVAMKHVMLSLRGGFIFKVAYDESYSRFSPGVNLELDHLRSWHSGQAIDWLDTCAGPRHPLFNLISNGRRMICRTLISNRSRRGDLLLSALPLARCLGRMRPSHIDPPHLRVSTRSQEPRS